MGGGKMTRPGFDRPQASSALPETEFYLLLQQALDQTPRLALPGCWAEFRPPMDQKLFAEDMPLFCRFRSQPAAGLAQVFAPGIFRAAYCTLEATGAGVPSALLLSEETTHRTLAVQLLPPVPCLPTPSVPDSFAALSLQLSFADLEADPARLGEALRTRMDGKEWLRHPDCDRWMEMALAAQQRDFNRRNTRAPALWPKR